MSVASSSVDAFPTAVDTYEVLPAHPSGAGETDEDVWDATDDNLQGPHNWRKLLSPVRTLSTTTEDEVTTTDGTSKSVDTNGVLTASDESVVDR